MATYAIGDIQGCFSALERLLQQISFNPSHDILWFTGDAVNRGTQSLETLRFIKNLGKRQHMVLGNHDLHLLAMAHGIDRNHKGDTLKPILEASDANELIDWLLQQPLMHYDAKLNYVMVHAGLASVWDLTTAQALNDEVCHVLRSDQRMDFFRHMYGNQPNQWSSDLQGWDRLRCIVNYFTRMRFCFEDGSLEFETKENATHVDSRLIPWFRVPHRVNTDLRIVFGHWAALGGVTNTENVFALDTGCVWGNCLTAMRLEDQQRFSVKCK